MKKKYPEKVILGLSGGVDSAVAAYLLLQQGYSVEALFMKNWEEDDTQGYCAAAEDLKDAQAVCEIMGIPLKTVNFSTEYWDRVFAHFLKEYRAGRTPNPDVLCNKEIKFSAFLDHAIALGADYIATGHYARIGKKKDRFSLLKGFDDNKDQSYFLYLLNQQQLQRSLFVVGELEKKEVRQIAHELALPVATKKDSTGICFIGERPFNEFLQKYIKAEPGDIKTVEGKLVGRHNGLTFFTIGQRQGIGIGGIQGDNSEPWYVANKDIANNVLVVAQGKNHSALFKTQLQANQLHWVSAPPEQQKFTCAAKTRYRQSDQICEVEITAKETVKVTFTQPQRAITPGQSIVFYDNNECLGGAIIL